MPHLRASPLHFGHYSRDEDPTGVPGIGAVAEGRAILRRHHVIRWAGAYASTLVWPDLDAAMGPDFDQLAPDS